MKKLMIVCKNYNIKIDIIKWFQGGCFLSSQKRQTQGEPGRSEETTSIKHRSNRSQWSRETNKLAITRAATHEPPRPTRVATRTRRKRRDPPPKSSRTFAGDHQ
ncbi:unnamed protein product [Eruca vesicaria subsp. sativa]|uniref:Uncharacterized protein n=1 Tax=Eruca vesicaria subsp. sativa TaxID=29727 RepID=A0ABC8M5F3_ERUVS|nr:unnamed protein product [Eruca vesicaria subsp. sativa]